MHCAPTFVQLEHGDLRSHLTFLCAHKMHERTRCGLLAAAAAGGSGVPELDSGESMARDGMEEASFLPRRRWRWMVHRKLSRGTVVLSIRQPLRPARPNLLISGTGISTQTTAMNRSERMGTGCDSRAREQDAPWWCRGRVLEQSPVARYWAVLTID